MGGEFHGFFWERERRGGIILFLLGPWEDKFLDTRSQVACEGFHSIAGFGASWGGKSAPPHLTC